MEQLRKAGSFIMPFALIVILVVIVTRLLGPKIGNTFSTINACLPNGIPCEVTPTSPGVSVTELAEPTAGDSSSPVEDQLEQIDQVLKQSVRSSIAYNVPATVLLDQAVTIELLLNPSASPTQLVGQITPSGQIVTATIDITPMMKAELIARDAGALTIRPIHADAVQLVGSADTTRWEWLVTGKKAGPQRLILVIHRLVRFEGQEYWREVQSYQAEINVEVTLSQRFQSTGWTWAAGALLAVLLMAVLWRGYNSQRRKDSRRRGIAALRGSTGHIFISYRRSDSADIAGRIYDRLADEFGRPLIFKDVDSIPLGTDFKEYLDKKVSECNVLLAIIGDRWTEASDAAGKRRLDDPADFVRVEIESALEREIPVIPLLVRGAQMPEEESLPPGLRKLVYRNGTQVRPDPDFHRDMDRLISALEEFVR